jgi:hypothetical protein
MRNYAHVLAITAVCVILTACSASRSESESDYSRHSGKFTKRYDEPLTYAQAKEKGIDFPLPASAYNIHYGIYGLWQFSNTRNVVFS